uniref:Uncharacterized protein n=1 Tax=Rhizophagus irregularis (strain DAOM 181602 / DAOM 197198 / MUCL 43194) TaxID=747089 RepID=U9TFC0_RHIID
MSIIFGTLELALQKKSQSFTIKLFQSNIITTHVVEKELPNKLGYPGFYERFSRYLNLIG